VCQLAVEAVDPDDQIKLYTSLYHVFTVPTKFSEVPPVICCRSIVPFVQSGGYYVGMDNGVHQLTDGSRCEDIILVVYFVEHISVIILTCHYGIPIVLMLPCSHCYNLKCHLIL